MLSLGSQFYNDFGFTSREGGEYIQKYAQKLDQIKNSNGDL